MDPGKETTVSTTIATADPGEHQASIQAAIRVLDEHMAGLNTRDRNRINATLHFPHHRLSGPLLKTWENGDVYFDDFLARAGDGWERSEWDFRNVIAAGQNKVHMDVQFTRYHKNGSALGQYRSLWVLTRLDGRWGAQMRSSFAS